jgi:GST-like protein
MHPGKILENASGLFVCAGKVRRKKVTLDHPIFTRWPAQDPDRLQLFSAPTPNGVKVGIMLEETGLAYEPHRIDIMADGPMFGQVGLFNKFAGKAYEHKRPRDR